MIIQPIIDIAEICSQHGITQAVISPGSRNAALTLAFARHPDIETYVIPDERSAGYIALGLAQSSQKPVAMICTSGTATANLYPAIIEAFYQSVPLIVLTADRPPEWIDQQDGQTIRQQNLYGNHVLGSYQFPVSFGHQDAVWHAYRMVNEAILKSNGRQKGPVHINVPIREPFYPSEGEKWQYSNNIKKISLTIGEPSLSASEIEKILKSLKDYKRIMVVLGQMQLPLSLVQLLSDMQKSRHWVVIGDITSNINKIPGAITKHDLILLNHNYQNELAPDLVITLGGSLLSKSLKGFLRRNSRVDHWHVGGEKEPSDTFKLLTNKIEVTPEYFFNVIQESDHIELPGQKKYFEKWQGYEDQSRERIEEFLVQTVDGEFKVLRKVIEKLPDNCDLHLSNSMPVRYASFVGLGDKANIRVWSNRGTSGIDGCSSTTVGHAINTDRIQVLITGDLAFFYDRNAFWHPHLPDNLKLVILNNHGGGIFRLIDGPKQQPELKDYFETSQALKAENTAKDFGMAYYSCENMEELGEVLNVFFSPKTGKAILEIETDPEINQNVFEMFKNHFRK